MKRYLEFLKTEVIYSPAVLSIITIWSIWTHILATSADVHGSLHLRIVLAALSIGPSVAILNLYKMALRGKSPSLKGILTAIFIAGAARGFTLAVLFKTFNVTDKYNFAFRIPNGLILISFAYIVATIFVGAFREQREVLLNLRLEKLRLLAAASELRGQKISDQENVTSQISELLHSEVNNLEKGSAEATLESLRRLIGDVVRPLSHELANRIPKWDPTSFELNADRITMREVLNGIKPENSINIPILLSLMCLETIPFITVYGLGNIIKIFIAILLLFPLSLKTAQLLLTRYTMSLSTAIRLLLLVLALGTSALPAGYVISFIIKDSPNPYYFIKAGVSFTILAAGLITAATSIQVATRKIREDLYTANDELRWMIARINLVSWNIRGVVSRNLHGPIQTTIHGAVFQLKKAIESNTYSPALMGEIQHKVVDAISLLKADETSIESVEKVFADIASMWEGTCQITIDAPHKILDQVTSDEPAKSALIDIVRESVSNAVRHAGATRVFVGIGTQSRQILITTVNDGKSFNPENPKGLGLGMLETISLHSSISRDGDKTVIETAIPALI